MRKKILLTVVCLALLVSIVCSCSGQKPSIPPTSQVEPDIKGDLAAPDDLGRELPC